jgi:hypothetical protein
MIPTGGWTCELSKNYLNLLYMYILLFADYTVLVTTNQKRLQGQLDTLYQFSSK